MSWEDDRREVWDRINANDRAIASHLAACEERHKEIQRRFEHADSGRRDLYGKMEAGFGELRGRFDTAHTENRNSISRVERSGLERWLQIVTTILLAVATGLLGYFLRK